MMLRNKFSGIITFEFTLSDESFKLEQCDKRLWDEVDNPITVAMKKQMPKAMLIQDFLKVHEGIAYMRNEFQQYCR